jgi:hypothetical protein
VRNHDCSIAHPFLVSLFPAALARRARNGRRVALPHRNQRCLPRKWSARSGTRFPDLIPSCHFTAQGDSNRCSASHFFQAAQQPLRLAPSAYSLSFWQLRAFTDSSPTLSRRAPTKSASGWLSGTPGSSTSPRFGQDRDTVCFRVACRCGPHISGRANASQCCVPSATARSAGDGKRGHCNCLAWPLCVLVTSSTCDARLSHGRAAPRMNHPV